jgi:hypothetical protein
LATPARLIKLKCPRCPASHWLVDNDFYGPDLRTYLDYEERTYDCPQCGLRGPGFHVQKKTPVGLSLRANWLFEIFVHYLGARRNEISSAAFPRKLPD